jgi:hypothetical protein
MRWRTPQENEVRVKTFYAWLPVRCITTGEWRWLEYVSAQCMYTAGIGGKSWIVVKFLE